MQGAFKIVFLVVGRLFSVVEFATKSDMLAAIKKLDGTELSGRKIKVTADMPKDSGKRR